MEDLDDLIDEFDDSPPKKKTYAKATDYNKAPKYNKRKASDDEFDDMLDDVLGPDSYATKEKRKETKKKEPYSAPMGNDDFPDFGEEKKTPDTGGWGDSAGSTSYTPGTKANKPKQPKKGDKCYPVVLAGEDTPSGY